ncbi:MAG: DNA polymerase III subunit delta' [Betaproteobacteria bacterium]
MDEETEFAGAIESTAPYAVADLLPWQVAPLRAMLAQRERWHHGTLLHGPAGSGSRRLALHLAQGLLCRNPAQGLACGTCDACHLFRTGGHPDFRLVQREYDDKNTRTGEPRRRDLIIIDQLRALIDGFIYLTSHLQGAKVLMFYLAEEMNRATANALLKSLEEPPPATYFLLVSHQVRLLPPTILSRCRKVPSPQPTVAEAAAWLMGQGAKQSELVLAQAGGAPLKAMAMQGDDYQGERVRFLERLAEPRRLSVIGLGAELDAAARAQKKARLVTWLDLLATWSDDLAACASGLSPRYHPDFSAPLARLATTVAPRGILRYHRTLLRDRGLLAHPLNPRLVAENALFGYRQAVLGEIAP